MENVPFHIRAPYFLRRVKTISNTDPIFSDISSEDIAFVATKSSFILFLTQRDPFIFPYAENLSDFACESL